MLYCQRRRRRGPLAHQRHNTKRLQKQLNEQRRRLAALERVIYKSRSESVTDGTIEGKCAQCADGILFHDGDRIYCRNCGYVAFL